MKHTIRTPDGWSKEFDLDALQSDTSAVWAPCVSRNAQGHPYWEGISEERKTPLVQAILCDREELIRSRIDALEQILLRDASAERLPRRIMDLIRDHLVWIGMDDDATPGPATPEWAYRMWMLLDDAHQNNLADEHADAVAAGRDEPRGMAV